MFKSMPIGNERHELDGENFVSYRDFVANDPFMGFPSFAPDAEADQEETALNYNEEWFILNGDHRSAYEKATTGDAAIVIYQELETAHRSSWSGK